MSNLRFRNPNLSQPKMIARFLDGLEFFQSYQRNEFGARNHMEQKNV